MTLITSCRYGLVLSTVVLLLSSMTVAAEPVEISYTVWGGAAPEQPVITAFEASHPQIRIKFSAGGNIDKYMNKLLVMEASGEAPDVYGINVPNTERFFSMGAALPLDALVIRDKVNMNAFLPRCFTYAKYDGELYGFPRGTRGHHSQLKQLHITEL